MIRGRLLFSLATLALAAVPLSSCHAPPREAFYVCSTVNDCPTGWTCRADHLCWSTPGGDGGAISDAGDAGSPTDAGMPDANVDAGPPNITAIVVDGTMPAAGIEVLFHDSSGNLVDDVTSAANGEARTWAPDVGYVTVVSGTSLFTVTDVHALDVITFDVNDFIDDYVFVQVALPGAYSGADSYLVGGVNNSQTTMDPAETLSILDWSDQTNIIGLALMNDRAIAFSAIVDGAPLAGTVTLPSWRADFSSVDFAITGVPSGTTPSVSGCHYLLPHGCVSINADPVDGASGTLRLISDVAFDALVARWPTTISAGVYLTRWSYEVPLTTPATVTADFGGGPTFSDFSANRNDPARPAMAWTASGTYDIGLATLSYQMTGASTGVTWTFQMPPARSSIAALQLVGELSSLSPAAEVPQYSTAVLRFHEAVTEATRRSHPTRVIQPDPLVAVGFSGSF